MRIHWTGVVTLAMFLASGPAALAAGDAGRGATAFQQCTACHSVEPQRHLTGPSLAHVWGRKAATAEGFDRYSDALRRSGLTWNEDTLNRWLAGPAKLVPGTAMNFPGVPDERARGDIVAYLKAVSEGNAPAPSRAGMGGMMGGMMNGTQPADLKKAAADEQVVGLSHCRDTYAVRTADGKIHKVWEYNLRLKTDSSMQGPSPGKPVMAESGMRGDRFSIVFASPKELGGFIKESCD
jgi:cytochrome c